MYIIFRKKSAAITGLPGGNLSGDVFESAIFVFKYHELIRLIIPCQALDTLSISFSRARWSGFLCNVEVALSTTFGRPLLNWIPLIGYSVQFGWTWMSSNDPLLRYTFWPWILLPLLYFSLCLTKKNKTTEILSWIRVSEVNALMTRAPVYELTAAIFPNVSAFAN